MLEGLQAAARLQLLGMADGACGREVLVAAAMIEMIMRVDHVFDILWSEFQQTKLAERRLLGGLKGLFERQHTHDVVVVVPGIEHVTAIPMFDEDRVAGKADLARGAEIPEHVKAIDHQRSAIEQINLGFRHDVLLSRIDSSRLALGVTLALSPDIGQAERRWQHAAAPEDHEHQDDHRERQHLDDIRREIDAGDLQRRGE